MTNEPKTLEEKRAYYRNVLRALITSARASRDVHQARADKAEMYMKCQMYREEHLDALDEEFLDLLIADARAMRRTDILRGVEHEALVLQNETIDGVGEKFWIYKADLKADLEERGE